MNYPKRKRTRLKDFDYSQNGAYFITICTKDKKKILGCIPIIKGDTSNPTVGRAAPCLLVADKNTSGQPTVGQAAPCLPHVHLSERGKITEKYILNIPKVYANVTVDTYVIMPNHIHMILCLTSNPNGRQEAACPTVSDIVRSIKILVRKEIGESIFQSSFHDHIIRNEQDYLEIWKYIENNPAKWEEDSLYIK